MINRLVLTVVAFVAWRLAAFFLGVEANLSTGRAATGQFENSDLAYGLISLNFGMFRGINVIFSIALVAALVWIWWRPMMNRTKRITAGAVLMMIVGTSAQAFYATTDVTEVYYVLPNQSAFFIPDVGANRDNQAQFGSVDYLNQNKVAAKRFVIPHSKLSGTGGTAVFSGPDFYVPTGRLIIVDRTPFFKEWVDASDRGTSRRKEGFLFETKDSINIGTGVTISAYVAETEAATFLYWFGTRPVDGDITKPDVQFQSVIRGMSLAEVMDGVVHAKVQEALANEFGTRSFDQAIADKRAIIQAVLAAVRAEFQTKGITIGFLGYSGALDFAPALQASIDRTVIATRDRAVAETLKDSLVILQNKALIDATAGLVTKWDGKLPALPSILVVPPNLATYFSAILPPPAKP